jgi:hypothetical protein
MEMARLVVDEALRGSGVLGRVVVGYLRRERGASCQSCIEVRVAPTKGGVRLLRYGVQGRLRWGKMGVPPGARPPSALTDLPLGWVVEMPRER